MSKPPPLPQQHTPRKSLFTVRRVLGVIIVLVVVRGCFWGSESSETSKIVGKWTLIDGSQRGAAIEFTDGGKVLLTTAKSSDNNSMEVGFYSFDSSTLSVRKGDTSSPFPAEYDVEFRTDNELLLVLTDDGLAQEHFEQLSGRWQRVGVSASVGDIASLDNAGRSAAIQTQIKDLRQRRASIQELIDKAVVDKSELVARLKQSGVNTSSDLKANPAARQIAQNLVRLTSEIQSLQRDAMRLDEAIGKAESLIRRIGQSQVAISSDEFESLTGELMTAAEIRDGSTANATLDPVSLETLLDNALSSTPPVASVSGNASQLVGKWKITTGRAKDGILELNPKGSAVFSYFEDVVMKREETILGNWKWKNGVLELQEPRSFETKSWHLEIEFISPNEIVAINKDYPYGGFGPVSGKLERLNK